LPRDIAKLIFYQLKNILNNYSLSTQEVLADGSTVRIYPNPFSSATTLQTGKIFNGVTLTIYNSIGETVKQIKNISGQTVTLSRDNLASGLYFIRLTEENKVITVAKLVITDTP